MAAKSGFICKGIGNELSMLSSCNGVINKRVRLVDREFKHELELNVVGHDVDWEVDSFKDCNHFVLHNSIGRLEG